MDISERIEHSKYLKWGDVAQLAKKANVDRKSIERYVKGQFNTCTCYGLVDDLLRQRKSEAEAILNEMKP